MKLYKCNLCGNVLMIIEDAGVQPICCNEQMNIMEANTTDGANEKHVPVVSRYHNLVTVKVGDIPHPMSEEHYIKWITLETNKGTYTKYLNPNEEPLTVFNVEPEEEVIAAYEYCNIHGLWMAKCDSKKNC